MGLGIAYIGYQAYDPIGPVLDNRFFHASGAERVKDSGIPIIGGCPSWEETLSFLGGGFIAYRAERSELQASLYPSHSAMETDEADSPHLHGLDLMLDESLEVTDDARLDLTVLDQITKVHDRCMGET